MIAWLKRLVSSAIQWRSVPRPYCSDCGGIEPDCAGNCTGFPPGGAA